MAFRSPISQNPRVAFTNLPKAGDAGLHQESATVRLRVEGHFTGNRRTGTHQRHFAPEHIETAGFIEGRLADEASHPGDAGSSFILKVTPDAFRSGQQLLQPRLGIHHHGAVLQHLELPAVKADAGLTKKHRAAIQFDEDRQQRKTGARRIRATMLTPTSRNLFNAWEPAITASTKLRFQPR